MSNEQQQGENKEEKKFQKNYSTLVALLTGDTLLKRTKAGPDTVAEAMSMLVAEEKAEKTVLIKTKAKALVDSVISFNKFKKEKEREFLKVIEDKQKEFNKEADSLFGMIEDIRELEQTYYDALRESTRDPLDTDPAPIINE